MNYWRHVGGKMNNILVSKIALIFTAAIAAILGWLFISKLFFLWMPFLIAYIVAKLLNPAITLVCKTTRVPRPLVSILSVASIVALGTFGIIRLGAVAIDKLKQLIASLPGLGTELINLLKLLDAKIQTLNLPFTVHIDISSLGSQGVNYATDYITKSASGFASGTFGFITSLPGMIVFFMVTMISCFLILKDFSLINEKIAFYFNKHIGFKKEIDFFLNKVILVIWGYLKAQLLLISLTFVISFIGLTLMGYTNSAIMAVGIAAVDALPIFGPATVYAPWIIVTLILGNKSLAMMLLSLYLVCTFTRQLLEPKVVGHHIGIYPLVTLISMYTGLQLMGLAGIIIGPLLIITVKTYFEHRKQGIDSQ
jgi:sporulation integral membrane protein YtvI